MRGQPTHAKYMVCALALLFAACGGRAPAPTPGTSQGTPPDLRGRRVLVLPVQQSGVFAGDADAEIAFALTARSTQVDWIMSAELERVLERSPGLNARSRGLPVGHFLAVEVRRVGDPLYGLLRRISALVDAEAILIPIQVASVTEEGADPKVHVAATLIESRTGRVVWFGIVEGQAFSAGDVGGLASAADMLARTLLWYVGA